MPYKYNIFTGNFDYVLTASSFVGTYVRIVGDTMTGDLTVPTLYATDSGESTFNGGIIIKAGEKLYFDGA